MNSEHLLEWTLRVTRSLRELVEALMDPEELPRIQEVADDGCLRGNGCEACEQHYGQLHKPDCPHYTQRLVEAAKSAGMSWKQRKSVEDQLRAVRGGVDPTFGLKHQLEQVKDQLAEAVQLNMIYRANMSSNRPSTDGSGE